jgi:DNA-binding NarL/FixJ family response regulator
MTFATITSHPRIMDAITDLAFDALQALATRVLIVDDDPRFRALARVFLERAGFSVAAEAADAEQALRAARRLRPDAALVDMHLPGVDGLALARPLAEAAAGIRIVLTSTDPTLVPDGALAASGALAFVPKDDLALTDLTRWFGSETP